MNIFKYRFPTESTRFYFTQHPIALGLFIFPISQYVHEAKTRSRIKLEDERSSNRRYISVETSGSNSRFIILTYAMNC